MGQSYAKTSRRSDCQFCDWVCGIISELHRPLLNSGAMITPGQTGRLVIAATWHRFGAAWAACEFRSTYHTRSDKTLSRRCDLQQGLLRLAVSRTGADPEFLRLQEQCVRTESRRFL